jgi:hypothetical protein
MITSFDDYCIHQTHEPVAQPAQSDRNFYDRYWFNGFDVDGRFLFEIGFGLYPNRRVMDAHFSVVVDGVQHSFHASRRAPRDRAQTTVGPLTVRILEPLRRVQVILEPNETGVACELIFSARSIAAEEPKSVLHDDGRLIMHTSRFTQFGSWAGHFSVGGRRHEVLASHTRGARDKSWGVRPVGEPEGGAPGLINGEPGVYWVWAPIDFGDVCTQFNTFQGREGETQQLGACLMPAYADPAAIPETESGLVEMKTARHRVHWLPGTRRAGGASISLVEASGTEHTLTLEPVLDFLMKGIGYSHPQWGHGFWKGELAIAGESWRVDEQPVLDFANIHVHQLVRARMGERVGYGTLETICFGRHAPSGFAGILDGAPGTA